ncbi:phosphoribosylanthranilate isomerase [Mongoliitalea lutea]|uniref:N-(5'-phosphoribosyl)anthranilate isomerase n=1 Tax=Mongoliitalea lutea TaxID=849756 RepID=A0A8J3CTV6_9BACT|nr:phosphoribosylanthranilate isomerase [Mongoliitalea lutea]GHB28464.1 N-(5'-phosphoribosyl)anthranilate isomerase [Mongoliitalea lutea]
MLIKVCGMRDLENIQNLQARVQPDYMGLIFYPPSPRYVGDKDPGVYHSIQLRKVGVFVDEELEKVLDRVKTYGLNGVQLHGKESKDYILELKKHTNVFVWKVWSVKEELNWESLRPYEELIDAFLFDTFTEAHGGSGKLFNWQLLANYPFDKPFFLSGGLSLTHAAEITQLKSKIPQLVGVDLNSKFEISPGLKDIEQLVAFKNSLLNTEINEGSI